MKSFFASQTLRAQAATISYEYTVKGHGRLHSYRLRATSALNAYLANEYEWPDVGYVVCIEHSCVRLATGEVQRSVHYAITSLLTATAQQLFELWHQHWHSENKSHWVRDVVFGEDGSRVRSGILPQVFALIRTAVIARFRLAGLDSITAARSQVCADLSLASFLVGIP